MNTHAVGIDIGGTKTAVGLVDQTGHIVASTAFETQSAAGFNPAIERMLSAIRQVTGQAGCPTEQLAGVGIGCPGPVNPGRGTIHNPFTLPGWDGCNVVAPLQEALGVRVRLENDADAAVMGEGYAGAAKGRRRVVMLTLGTGVGSGVLIDGEIYRGHGGEHPELGHIPIDADGPKCYCGISGCLESIASGTAIAEAGAAVGLPDCRTIFTAAAQGNPQAARILDRAVAAVVTAGWTVYHTFLPELLVLGGGLMEDRFDPFTQPLQQSFEGATMVPRDAVCIVRAELGNRAGIVGAASLVL